MKKIFLLFFLSITFLCVFPRFVFAAEADTQSKSQVMITVVMPDITPTPAPTPTPVPKPTTPAAPSLYPSSIEETEVNGSRQIVKVYELGAGENPKDIPRDSFKRDGWEYDLSDITKSETSSTDKQDHTETVKVDTSTNDTTAILQQLAPTLDYKSDDGYIGTLTLDITSIKVETAGTKTSSYTVSATREYPNLSNEDTSLVPKSITDNGRTMKLADIQWRAQTIDGIDGEQIPSTYTAVAQYTGTGSKTVITGYVTTADYKGSISKTSAGKTIYKAIFIGTEIKPVPIPFTSTDEPKPTCSSAAPTNTASVASPTPAPSTTAPQATASVTETPSITAAAVTAPAASQTPLAANGQEQSQTKPVSPWPIVLNMAIVMLLLNGVAYYFFLRKKSASKPESSPETKPEPKPETTAGTKDEASSKDDDTGESS